MVWVVLRRRGGDEIAVNLEHVVNIEPMARPGQNEPGAILTTVQTGSDAKANHIEVETPFRKLVNLTGAPEVDPPPPDYAAVLEAARGMPKRPR